MELNRVKMLELLGEVSTGLSRKELLEQSNCFVFQEGVVVAFNGEILARAKSPLPIEVVIPAEDFMKLLNRIPDDSIEVDLKDAELQLKGKKRSAGFTISKAVHLDYKGVPKAKEWKDLPEGFSEVLRLAANTCGEDETQPLTTVVHIGNKIVEACDNYRVFRAKTGFSAEDILIPASSLLAAQGMELKKMSIDKEWVHFKTALGTELSIHCLRSKYHTNIDTVLKVDGEKIVLPSNLNEILERAEVMSDGAGGGKGSIQYAGETEVLVNLEDGVLTMTARKETGWFREKRKVKYEGKGITFRCHPSLLKQIAEMGREAVVGTNRMKIEDGDRIVVLCLETGERKAKVEEKTEEAEE